jgi:hypothetical protein
MKSKYRSQQIVKEDNERKVLDQLRQGPLRFNELLSITGLSKRGLKEIIDRLRADNKIAKTIYDDNPAYAITDFGIIYFQERLWRVFGSMMDMKVENPLYLHSELFFGASMDIIQNDETIEHPLLKCMPNSKDISLYFLENIFHAIKKNKIKLDGRKYGKLVLAFEFDFGELSEEIFNAQTVIIDLDRGKDILTNEVLPLKDLEPDECRHKIVTILNTIRWIVSNKKYNDLMNKLTKTINRENHPELFSNLDPKILASVKKTMENHTWERDFPILKDEMEEHGHKVTYEHVSELYYYTDALEIINANSDAFYQDLAIFNDFMGYLAEKRVEESIRKHEDENQDIEDY